MPKASATDTRSYANRVQSWGSTRSGFHHWWQQRISALVLLFLSAWFVIYAVPILWSADFFTVNIWFNDWWNRILLLAFVISALLHAKIGLQVIIEDYIQNTATRITLLILLQLGWLGLSALLVILIYFESSMLS